MKEGLLKIREIAKLVLLITCFSFVTNSALGQYTSNVVTDDYGNAAAWSGTQPPANGTLTSRIYITAGAEITRSDVGSGNDIDARGNQNFNPGDGRRRYAGNIFGTFVINGNFTHDQGGRFRIHSGGTVEVFGNFSANNEIMVDDGGTLIVHGNLYIEDMGGGQHDFDGTIVVGGNAEIADFDMNNSAILVVGGDLTLDGNSCSRKTLRTCNFTTRNSDFIDT